MKVALFRKALTLKNQVIEHGEGQSIIFFEVAGKQVSIKTDALTTTFNNCTCMHCSIHGGVTPAVLCSYKLAVIWYLFEKLLRMPFKSSQIKDKKKT